MIVNKISKVIFFGTLFVLGTISIIGFTGSIKDIVNNVSTEAEQNIQSNNNNEDELYAPLPEGDKGEVVNNVGVRLESGKVFYKLIVTNIEDLYYIDSLKDLFEKDRRAILEIEAVINSNVISSLKKHTFAYINKSTVEFKNNVLTFDLLDVATDKLLAPIEVPFIFKEDNGNIEDKIIAIENIDALNGYIPSIAEAMLYAYSEIRNGVSKVNPDVESCLISETTIKSSDGSVSFDVIDSKSSKKITTIVLDFSV